MPVLARADDAGGDAVRPAVPAGLAVRVRVPATSANLGPGFDALGLALGLHDEVVVRVGDVGGGQPDRAVPGASRVQVEVAGEGAEDVPFDESHLVVRALLAGFGAMAVPPPAVRVCCTNRIPHGRGLGSSAAAVVAGLVAARALASAANPPAALDDGELLELAAGFEGHADNVAACLLGGLTLAWHDGQARALRLEPAPELAAVLFVPVHPVPTRRARSLLPATVPHADAAHAAGRAALLVEALTRRPELLLAATEDRLHQSYRAPAMPVTAALVSALRSVGVAAVVSGAGPSVLALCTRTEAPSLPARAGPAAVSFTDLLLPVEREGAAVAPV